jgi:hypothetical protein
MPRKTSKTKNSKEPQYYVIYPDGRWRWCESEVKLPKLLNGYQLTELIIIKGWQVSVKLEITEI